MKKYKNILNHLIFLIVLFINYKSIYPLGGLIPLPKETQRNVFIYLNFCQQGYLSNFNTNPETESKPKISVVIPMYNEQENAKMVIRSIQNQSLKEIEIVCVNDFSTDNTLKILKELQKEDNRIVIINNKKNRGVMYNRIYGALQSKGEYVTFADADDAYCNPEILRLAYNAGKGRNIDLVHFHTVGGTYDNKELGDLFLFAVYNPHIFDQVIRQPVLGENYFANGNNVTGSGLVFDKIYSRKLIRKISDYLGEDLWNQNLIYMDDALLAFASMKCADTFMLIDQIGYWHWLGNGISTTSNAFEYEGYKLKNPKKSNKKLGDYMIVMEKILDLTEEEPREMQAREYYIKGLGEDQYLHGFARTVHFDKYMSLIERFINWKYIDKATKKRMIEYAKFILSYSVDIKLKYSNLLNYNENKKKDL